MTALRSASFYPRPLGLAPLFDSRFIPLAGSPLRLLAGPAELVQDPRDVIGMIADAEPPCAQPFS